MYGIADRLDLIDDTFSQLDKTSKEKFSQEELEQIIKEAIDINWHNLIM